MPNTDNSLDSADTPGPFTVVEPGHVPSPNDPPWNTPAAIGVWIASVALILILPNVFLIPYLVAQNAPMTDPASLMEFVLSDPIAVLLNIVAIIPAHILTLVLAWLVVTRLRRYSFRQTLGWTSNGLLWWHYIIILAAIFAVVAVVSNYLPEKENDLMRIIRSSRAALYLVAFMATVTAPVVEEVVYRGILYSAFQRTFGVPAAVLVVTFLFTIVHVPQYYPSFSTIFLLTLLSLVLTLVRAITGNLLPCIILHFVFNAMQSATLVLEPWLPGSLHGPDPAGAIITL